MNVKHLTDIQEYCNKHSIRHQYAFLGQPNVLSVKYKNWLTNNVDMDNVATDRDNTTELSAFLELEEAVRPGIERFWI